MKGDRVRFGLNRGSRPLRRRALTCCCCVCGCIARGSARWREKPIAPSLCVSGMSSGKRAAAAATAASCLVLVTGGGGPRG